MSTANPIYPSNALLRPNKPDIYPRNAIYDPTWAHPSYDAYEGMKIVPYPCSIVQDPDTTPLWVVSVDPDTLVPTYEAMRIGSENDNVVSILNYGNSTLRLYVDYRAAPYPATPDTKCVFIGKSPRFYTIARYPRTAQETIISQYFDQSGELVGQMVPLQPLDDTRTSWYLQRGHLNHLLDDNEEVLVRIYNEDGVEVYSATLFVKESAVINEDTIRTPTIVGVTVTSNQRLANGDFFLYETQDFGSLGLQVSLVYDDGSTYQVPIDGVKCVLYGQDDFISSFSGLRQNLIIKYFRSEHESIDPMLADATGSMITKDIVVSVVPNSLGVTTKIMVMPYYNASTARYVLRYYMYFGDGRAFIDVTGYVSIIGGSVNTTSPYFGQWQTFVVAVDMKNVDPTNYPASARYQQSISIQFGPPNETIKYQIRDSMTSTNIFGQDNSLAKRPSIRFDRNRGQAFIPSYIFGNRQAFLRSFYTLASPPYDPTIEQIPQTPTHFLLRDIVTGSMLITAPLPITSFNQAFSLLNDTSGARIGTTICVEFLNVISPQVRRTLFGVPVDVIAGTYIAAP